jgi:hypothetical protein
MRCSAHQAVQSRTKPQIRLHQQRAGVRAPFHATFAGCGLKGIMRTAVLALVACSTPSHGQTRDAGVQNAPAPARQPAPLENTAPGGDGLSDLNARTFSCVRAGLNAAAREAATAPSQGSYQFSYFKIIKDTHHSLYQVHFKSNYSDEPDLKYCVSIYCQQGWDPNTMQMSVRLTSSERKETQAAAHGADCGNEQMQVKRRAKR